MNKAISFLFINILLVIVTIFTYYGSKGEVWTPISAQNLNQTVVINQDPNKKIIHLNDSTIYYDLFLVTYKSNYGKETSSEVYIPKKMEGKNLENYEFQETIPEVLSYSILLITFFTLVILFTVNMFGQVLLPVQVFLIILSSMFNLMYVINGATNLMGYII